MGKETLKPLKIKNPHESPTPGDTYCMWCGLDQKYWEQISVCPNLDREEEKVDG